MTLKWKSYIVMTTSLPVAPKTIQSELPTRSSSAPLDRSASDSSITGLMQASFPKMNPTEFSTLEDVFLDPIQPPVGTAGKVNSYIDEDDAALQQALAASLNDLDPAVIKAKALVSRTQSGGLFNLGNTCWFNSLLQVFFTPDGQHRSALTHISRDPSKKNAEYAHRANSLLRILDHSKEEANYENNERLYDSTATFIGNLYQKNGALLAGQGYQEDAADGYQALMGYLNLENQISTTIPVLCAQHRTSVERENVTFSKLTLEPVLSLKNNETPCHSIQELIDASNMRIEKLKGEEKVHFGLGKEHLQEAVQLDYFASKETPPRPGDEITFQMPRFGFEKRNGAFVPLKDSSNIEVNPEISFTAYTGEAGFKVKGALKLVLTSVVCHLGENANDGHYVAYVLNENNTLTQFNDAKVTPDTLDSITNTGYLATYKVIEFQEGVESRAQRPIVSSPKKAPAVEASSLVKTTAPSSENVLLREEVKHKNLRLIFASAVALTAVALNLYTRYSRCIEESTREVAPIEIPFIEEDTSFLSYFRAPPEALPPPPPPPALPSFEECFFGS